jgi:hypothetical protein
MPLRGAYFKSSIVALQHCRSISNETIDFIDTFHVRIEFEQTIGSLCHKQCLHSQLYQCSSISNTCQCRSSEFGIERVGHLCVDTELGSNCSHTSERCRRQCHIEQQLSTGQLDHHCQCPLGTRRVRSKNIYRCELPTLIECDETNSNRTCPSQMICRQNRCLSTLLPMLVNQSFLSLSSILLGLLIGALLIIITLIIGLMKMRSVKCVKFVHPSHVLSAHSGQSSPDTMTRLSAIASSSSPCSTLSSSSKSVQLSSTTKILDTYRQIELFE